MNRRLVLIVCLQMVLLLSVVGKFYYVSATGATVSLETAPVDPKDLMYGDYVRLNYQISTLEKNSVKTDLVGAKRDTQVYVVLEKGRKGFYEAMGIYEHKPTLTAGQVMLKGKLDVSPNDTFRVKFGLERYYVPAGSGEVAEKYNCVDVRVTTSGDAVINGLRSVH